MASHTSFIPVTSSYLEHGVNEESNDSLERISVVLNNNNCFTTSLEPLAKAILMTGQISR